MEHSLKASTAALHLFAALAAAPSSKKLLLSNLDAILCNETAKRKRKLFQAALNNAIASGAGHVSLACQETFAWSEHDPQRNPNVLLFIKSCLWASTGVQALDTQFNCSQRELYHIGPVVASHIAKLTGLRDLSLDAFTEESDRFPRNSNRSRSEFKGAVRLLSHLTRLQLKAEIGPDFLADCVAPLRHLQSLTANIQHPRNPGACLNSHNRYEPFPDSDINALVAALAHLSNLTTLQFQQTCTHQKRVETFDKAPYSEKPQLIKRNMLTDAQMRAFTSVLEGMPRLADVCLPIVSVTEGTLGLIEVLAMFCCCTRLQALPCSCTSFREESPGYAIQQQAASVPASQLIQALCSLPHLQQLQWGAAAKASGNAFITAFLQCTDAMPPGLSSMTLECQADSASKALLLAAIGNGCRSNLKELCVDHRVLRASCSRRRDRLPGDRVWYDRVPAVDWTLLKAIPVSIASAYNLQTLRLKGLAMDTHITSSVAASLRILEHLTCLQLEGTISSQSYGRFEYARFVFPSVLQALASLSKLQSLALESLAPSAIEQLGSAAIKALATTIPQLQALTCLSLTYCVHNSAVASHELFQQFCARLTALQQLQQLHIPFLIPTSMMKELAAAVAELPMLTYLRLEQNHFLENSEEVAESLRCGRARLRHLELSREGSSTPQTISDEGMAAIADLVLCNPTLWHVSVSAGSITASGALLCPPAVETWCSMLHSCVLLATNHWYFFC